MFFGYMINSKTGESKKTGGHVVMSLRFKDWCVVRGVHYDEIFLLNSIYQHCFRTGKAKIRMDDLYKLSHYHNRGMMEANFARFEKSYYMKIERTSDYMEYTLTGKFRALRDEEFEEYGGESFYLLSLWGQSDCLYQTRGSSKEVKFDKTGSLVDYNLHDKGVQKILDEKFKGKYNEYDRDNFLNMEHFRELILVRGLRELGIDEEILEKAKHKSLEDLMKEEKEKIESLVVQRQMTGLDRLQDLEGRYNLGRKIKSEDEGSIANYEGAKLRVYSMDVAGKFPNEYLDSYELRNDTELYFASEETRVRNYVMGSATGVCVEEVAGEMPLLLEGLLCHLGIDMGMWTNLREKGNLLGLELDDMEGMAIYYIDMSDEDYNLEKMKIMKDRRNMVSLCEIIHQYISKNLLEGVFIGKFNQALSKNYLANVSKLESETVKNNRTKHEMNLAMAKEKHLLDIERLKIAQQLAKDNGVMIAPPKVIIQTAPVKAPNTDTMKVVEKVIDVESSSADNNKDDNDTNQKETD